VDVHLGEERMTELSALEFLSAEPAVCSARASPGPLTSLT
jgi:hypothetical protein